MLYLLTKHHFLIPFFFETALEPCPCRLSGRILGPAEFLARHFRDGPRILKKEFLARRGKRFAALDNKSAGAGAAPAPLRLRPCQRGAGTGP